MSADNKYVSARGIRFHYRDWGGDGTPVLLFHGDQRASGSWNAVARRLRDRFHVLALDGRGHGDSNWPPRGYRIADQVEDMLAVLDALGLGPVCAIAHSSGAAVTAFSATWKPQAFKDLMLIEPPTAVDERFLANAAKRAIDSRRVWPSHKEYEDYLTWNRATRVWHPEVIRDVAYDEAFDRPDGQVESKWAPQTLSLEERQGDTFQLPPQLSNLTHRTCIVVRAERPQEDIARTRDAVAQMKNGHLILFHSVGHNVYMEQPDLTAQLIADFLTGAPLPDRLQAPQQAPTPES